MKENTYEFVVGAADGLRSAGASRANAEDVDGGASEADGNGQILNDDSQERKETGSSDGISLRE